MEEKNINKELKEMLESVEKAIELYNKNVTPEEMVKLVNKNDNNVKDVFICAYNNQCVGLFIRKQCVSEIGGLWTPNVLQPDTAHNIYVGIDSDYVGIKQTMKSGEPNSTWCPEGYNVKLNHQNYLSNCNMYDGMSFDDMRLIMYNEGAIDSYKIGKATSEEMFNVLIYAKKYYNNKENVKTNEMTTNNKIERLKQIRDDLTAQPKEEQNSKQKTKK